MHNGLNRRLCLVAGAAACLPGGSALAADTVDGRWHDAARNRELPWRLRRPAGHAASPLVVYSHGLGGGREGGEVWGAAWAAAGIAVLHLQHPGSDIDALRSGSWRAAASAEQLVARVQDLRFVLDELGRLASGDIAPWQGLQQDAVGVAGHSFGAHTVQALAGQRFGAPVELMDARPRAFIALSPSSPRAGGLGLKQSFGTITRPFMAVTGSHDGDPFGAYDRGEPRALVYEGLPAGQRALLWLEGADHMSFAGSTERRWTERWRRPAAARELQPAHHALVARHSTLWWRAHLQGDAQALQALAGPQGLAPGDRFVQG